MDFASKAGNKSQKSASRPSTGRKVGTKYSKVRATIDSGKTVRKVEVFSNRATSKLKGELFLRISSNALNQLITNSVENENINSYKSQDFSYFSPTHKNTKAVTVAPVIFSLINPQTLPIQEESDYIILDTRDYEDYKSAHIKCSVSFPSINISRGKFHPYLLQMKNKENKHVIIYSKDERAGIEVAQQLAQRHYYNVYLLTGGLIEFYKSYPGQVVQAQEFI